jgi:hypothetical protein
LPSPSAIAQRNSAKRSEGRRGGEAESLTRVRDHAIVIDITGQEDLSDPLGDHRIEHVLDILRFLCQRERQRERESQWIWDREWEAKGLTEVSGGGDHGVIVFIRGIFGLEEALG